MSDETKASATVSDYLRWRGDLTFAQDGFNEVDNLLLCIISYIKLENIPRLRSFDPQDAMPMGDVCRLLTEEDEQLGLSTLDYIPLMRQAAETPRFCVWITRMRASRAAHASQISPVPSVEPSSITISSKLSAVCPSRLSRQRGR